MERSALHRPKDQWGRRRRCHNGDDVRPNYYDDDPADFVARRIEAMAAEADASFERKRRERVEGREGGSPRNAKPTPPGMVGAVVECGGGERTAVSGGGDRTPFPSANVYDSSPFRSRRRCGKGGSIATFLAISSYLILCSAVVAVARTVGYDAAAFVGTRGCAGPRSTSASLSMSLSASAGLSSRSSLAGITLPLSTLAPLASSSTSRRTDLVMKVSSGKKRSRSFKGNSLAESNNERIKAAGRRGTKNFIDPTKLFLGNLAFDATESDVERFFEEHLGGDLDRRIESIKIIRDWKTGKSKGYGFVNFYEPVFATSALEVVKNKRLKGRIVRLDQGARKKDETKLYVKKERAAVAADDGEGAAIEAALKEAEGEDEDFEGLGMSEDDMIAFVEKGGLRGVMPLTEETAGFLGMEGLYDGDDDFDDNAGVDDGEFAYDGVFEELYNPKEYEDAVDEEEREKMNREQRRAEDKTRKKRKLPFKGFGAQ